MLNRFADRVRLRAFAESPLHPLQKIHAADQRGFDAGDEVLARIESLLPDGVCKVRIRGQSFALRLPCNAHPGDEVHLVVTTRDPKLKFSLLERPGTPAQPVSLSDAARFITALMEESSKLPLTATAASGVPLLQEPPGHGAALAGALHQALDESGIFYESHLAQWVTGTRPFAKILNEPQARLSRVSSPAKPIVRDSAGDLSEGTGPPELPVHRDALPIVKQQLDALNEGHVVWHGLFWPDQRAEWRIGELPTHSADSPGDRRWRMHLRLTLPELRDIEATFLTGKHGVAITVRTALAATAHTLTMHLAALRQSLLAAGIRPSGITIHPHAIP